jgi:hypothetical protein
MQKEHHGRDPVAEQISSTHGGQEAETGTDRKGAGKTPFEDTTPVIYFLKLGPTFHSSTTPNSLFRF